MGNSSDVGGIISGLSKLITANLSGCSKVTDNDVENAKKLIGANAKYLEDSELRTYASLYKENPSYADKLLNDTYYNIIQSGIYKNRSNICIKRSRSKKFR